MVYVGNPVFGTKLSLKRTFLSGGLRELLDLRAAILDLALGFWRTGVPYSPTTKHKSDSFKNVHILQKWFPRKIGQLFRWYFMDKSVSCFDDVSHQLHQQFSLEPLTLNSVNAWFFHSGRFFFDMSIVPWIAVWTTNNSNTRGSAVKNNAGKAKLNCRQFFFTPRTVAVFEVLRKEHRVPLGYYAFKKLESIFKFLIPLRPSDHFVCFYPYFEFCYCFLVGLMHVRKSPKSSVVL